MPDYICSEMETLRICILITLVAALASCQKGSVEDFDTEPDTELYALNRAALRKMDTGGTIAVTGHKSQDPDAVCSAMAMAALMRRLGMDAVAYIQEKPIQGVKFILDTFGCQYPNILDSVEPGTPLVLTDHNDYLQSVAGVEQANIVGIADHHPISQAFSTELPIYCKCMNTGACCSIVYSIYKECGIEPTQTEARLMLAGIIDDTDSLKKPASTAIDSLALAGLIAHAAIEDMPSFTQALYLAQNSFDGMTDLEIFMSDVKTYEIGGVRLAITSLNANGKMPISELCRRMHGVMPTVCNNLNVQMVFAKMEEEYVPSGENPDSLGYTTHFGYYGTGAKSVAEQAFGASASDHDDCIVLDYKLNRKADIVPALTKILR